MIKKGQIIGVSKSYEVDIEGKRQKCSTLRAGSTIEASYKKGVNVLVACINSEFFILGTIDDIIDTIDTTFISDNTVRIGTENLSIELVDNLVNIKSNSDIELNFSNNIKIGGQSFSTGDFTKLRNIIDTYETHTHTDAEGRPTTAPQ